MASPKTSRFFFFNLNSPSESFGSLADNSPDLIKLIQIFHQKRTGEIKEQIKENENHYFALLSSDVKDNAEETIEQNSKEFPQETKELGENNFDKETVQEIEIKELMQPENQDDSNQKVKLQEENQRVDPVEPALENETEEEAHLPKITVSTVKSQNDAPSATGDDENEVFASPQAPSDSLTSTPSADKDKNPESETIADKGAAINEQDAKDEPQVIDEPEVVDETEVIDETEVLDEKVAIQEQNVLQEEHKDDIRKDKDITRVDKEQETEEHLQQDRNGVELPESESLIAPKEEKKMSSINNEEDKNEDARSRSRTKSASVEAGGGPMEISPQSSRRFQSMIMNVWRDISSHKYSTLFQNAVTDADAPNYSKLIYEPTDLKTIRNGVRDSVIKNSLQFHREIMKMFANAMMFNSPGSTVGQMTSEYAMEADALINSFRESEGGWEGGVLTRVEAEEEETPVSRKRKR